MAKRRPWDWLLAGGFVAGTLGFGAATAAVAQGTLDVTSTPVAGVTADALAAGPDGSLWSVNQAANTISHVTFPDLHASTFTLPTAAAGLAGITAGPDGNMWFTESTARQIGRITPSGTISEFPIPATAASPQRIFPGPNGTLWSFNACFASGCSRFLVTTTAGASTEVALTVPNSASFSPANCTLGADGNVWCIGSESTQHPFGSHFTAARITPTGGYTAFVPATATQGSAIVAAPDGNVWYAWELPGGSTGVARVSPAGVITEYPTPTGKPQSWIFGLAVGSDGNLYFADRQTSILYELLLATATDAGTATLNSGSIAIDIPEDLVPVSNQSGATQVHTRAAPKPACATAFAIKSGGSRFGAIEWEQIEATECTDLAAGLASLRYGTEQSSFTFFVQCLDKPVAFSPNPAVNDEMVILVPPGSSVTSAEVDSDFQPGAVNGSCGLPRSGDFGFECTSAMRIIPQGGSLTALVKGTFPPGTFEVRCLSTTPERVPSDNIFKTRNTLGLPLEDYIPVGVTTRAVDEN